MDEALGVYKFASVGELAETVKQLLALGLQYKASLGGVAARSQKSSVEQIEQLILQQARDYLAEVREGFVLSVRTTQITKRAELRFLLDRVLLDWGALCQELGLADETSTGTASGTATGTRGNDETPAPGQAPERVRHQLLAFGMAATALGHLPRLPAEQVTFPYNYNDPPTYCDISAPDTAGEMLVRIEELEQVVWRLMGGDYQDLLNHRYGALRRTYGFFEVSAHLAHHQARRFGLKGPRAKLSLL